MKQFIFTIYILAISISAFSAELPEAGSIKGLILEKTAGTPLEFATIVVKNVKDTTKIIGGITDKNGTFIITGLAYGEYKVSYSYIGFDKIDIPILKLNAGHKNVDLGKLYISESSKSLAQLDVIGQRSTFVNSIDRKTFNVGTDLMSKSGSVSDLMMNIPSVQVDIDGNVSLRGSENVTILINGKSSSMMNLNRAAALQQMSASTIEKIEIITNPSAKFKPDGTSGIINIVLRKNKSLGFNGNITANVGNQNRRGFNVLLNYNPGKLNLVWNFGIRSEDRSRIDSTHTTTFLPSNLIDQYSSTASNEISSSTSYIGIIGFDYQLNKKSSIGSSINYNYRGKTKNTYSKNLLTDAGNIALYDYDRVLYLPEKEADIQSNSFFTHKFNEKGHELNVNFQTSFSSEIEDNHYTDTYRLPLRVSKDNMLYNRQGNESELAFEYTLPIGEKSKFEAGYIYNNCMHDMDLKRDTLVTPATWNVDKARSNRFKHDEDLHILYATYEQEIGNFGFLAGLRAEQTYSTNSLVTLDSVIHNQYSRIYPSLHCSYKLSEVHEMQLNYSHRINRPDDEDLNPFPEYKSLNNIQAGNPLLKPEDIHSFEMGYQYKQNSTSFLSTLYYRNHYNSVTSITRNLGNSVFLSTLENLGSSQSTGMELILSTTVGKLASLHVGTNTFLKTIDASALGLSSNKSIVTWTANANLTLNLTKTSVLQFTSNYAAKTITTQGYRMPTFALNVGFKQELFNKKASIILSASDIFNSNKSINILNTAEIKGYTIRRRSAQLVNISFIYSFGKSPNKEKDKGINYDNQL